MKLGDRWALKIPSNLAFGDKGVKPSPGNFFLLLSIFLFSCFLVAARKFLKKSLCLTESPRRRNFFLHFFLTTFFTAFLFSLMHITCRQAAYSRGRHARLRDFFRDIPRCWGRSPWGQWRKQLGMLPLEASWRVWATNKKNQEKSREKTKKAPTRSRRVLSPYAKA